MALYIGLCVVGFALLYFGAEWLVTGAASLAKSLGVAPIVIGLTVVAFGTSAPELVVSVVSSIKNESMFAVGNVIGSNICNIALVLGLAATLQPITCHRTVVRRDIPIMLGISALLLLLCLDDTIHRIDGAILFGGIILYTLMNYFFAKKEKAAGQVPDAAGEAEEVGFVSSRPKQVLLITVGIAGVVGGAELVVIAAEEFMIALGVSAKFIGLTIIAFGTSLPELATSVIAAMRKQMDISIGNLVGSNVFNVMSVLGAAALVRPISIPGGFIESGMYIDYLVMLGTSALPLLFLLWGNNTVRRWNGLVLLASYGTYIWFLIQDLQEKA